MIAIGFTLGALVLAPLWFVLGRRSGYQRLRMTIAELRKENASLEQGMLEALDNQNAIVKRDAYVAALEAEIVRMTKAP